MFKFKKPVTAFFFSVFGKCFSQENILRLTSCRLVGCTPTLAKHTEDRSNSCFKETAGSFNFILVEKATKFSLHIFGSIVKLEIMHDFSAALPEVLELLVTRTEH